MRYVTGNFAKDRSSVNAIRSALGGLHTLMTNGDIPEAEQASLAIRLLYLQARIMRRMGETVQAERCEYLARSYLTRPGLWSPDVMVKEADQ